MAFARILVLMDNRAESNWGSQATTTGLFEVLRERHPGAEIRGVPRSAARPPGVLSRRIAEAVAPRCLLAGRCRGWIARAAMRNLTQSWEQEWEWSDLVVVNGEGTLHPQRQVARWLPAICYLKRRSRRPLWVVNCSVHCAGTPDQSLFEAFLEEVDYLAVREPKSAKELGELGYFPIQAADCAFRTQAAPRDEAQAILDRLAVKRPFAVLTGSARVREWPIAAQRETIRRLRAKGLDVLYAHSEELDRRNALRLGIPLKTLSHEQASFQELAAIQGMAEIVVGGRFHPSLLAALCGTPFVAVASSTLKIEGLLQMLEAEVLHVPFDCIEELDGRIGRVLKQRDAWAARLQERAHACVPLTHANGGP